METKNNSSNTALEIIPTAGIPIGIENYKNAAALFELAAKSIEAKQSHANIAFESKNAEDKHDKPNA